MSNWILLFFFFLLLILKKLGLISTRIVICVLIIKLLVLTIYKNESFGNCDSKYLSDANIEESYNSLSKGWCKQKQTRQLSFQGTTVDDLNTCYEETVYDDGKMVYDSKIKCNKSPFDFK